MSSLVSGVGKIFTSIGSGVARLIPAVKAIGASVFTASAATGSGSGALGGLFGGGSGILSSMFNGVSSLFGGSTIGTTAGEFAGPWGQSLATAAAGATSATGVFPTAPTVGLGVGGGSSGLLGQLLNSQGAMGAIAGLGEGIGKYQELQSIEDMQATNLAYLQKQETDRRDSYEGLGPSLVSYNDKPQPPRQRTPTARIKMPTVVKYNSNTGNLETVTA